MRQLLDLQYLYLIPILLSALASLRAVKQKWPRPFRIFSLYLLSVLAVETFAVAWKLKLHNTAYWNYSEYNLWIYNAFVTIRHLFLLSFFYGIIKFPAVKKWILISIPPFMLFAVFNYFFWQTPHMVNNYTIAFANVITALLSLTFFYQVLRDKEVIALTRASEVWIVFGTFMYHAGVLPLFMFMNYLNASHQIIADSYFQINDALNILMYTLYLISFLCKPHSLKSPQ